MAQGGTRLRDGTAAVPVRDLSASEVIQDADVAIDVMTSARAARWRTAVWWLLVAGALGLAAQGDARFIAAGRPGPGVPWWGAALGMLALAAWWFDRSAAPAPRAVWRRADAWALAAVFALAVVTRLWRIGDYPPPDLFALEEFQTGSVAHGVLRGGGFPWEFPLTNILPALTFALIGLDAWGLRVPFLVGGIAAPLLLFLALRRLVSPPAAFAASALLASARWPATAARFADEVFFPIWVVALAFWLLVRAVQRRRQLDVLLSALVMSDLFYAYTAYRAFPLTAFGLAMVTAAVGRWRAHSQPGVWRHLTLVAVAWLILVRPGLISGGSVGGSVFAEAFNRHAAGWGSAPLQVRLAQMGQMMRTGVRVFVAEGDPMASVNIPGQPMLDAITGPLALLSVCLAAWRWRHPWRAALLAGVVVPFLGITFFPINLYVGRFFVLLVPLFALIAFAFDDLLRWRYAPRWTAAVVRIGALALAAYNLYGLQRLIDDPQVRESFLVPENTVVAAVHEAPPGARVVMLTGDASNALEQSDYRWYTESRTGGRPESLAEALVVDPSETAPIRWVTQGAPEAQLLPQLVALVCRDGEWRVRRGINTTATVATVQVPSGSACTVLPRAGLSGTYTITEADGPRTVALIDPALMVHTIPAGIAWQMQDRRARGLRVEWKGMLLPPRPGRYQIQLDLVNASGRIAVRGARAEVAAIAEQRWQSASLSLEMDGAAVPISVELSGQVGLAPAVRLWWQPPEGELQLIPPQALRPELSDSTLPDTAAALRPSVRPD